ncbi:peptidase inhibitor family I36 protein [Streptomyces sp. NPDC046805]|uniref:peptidase inhibitor family I36 protein n=1 Tax=Streptomyces sp. NPDC046805 TaxID=3155134 RepID=UPI0033E19B3A
MRKRLLALAGATLIATLPLTAQTASASSTCASRAVCDWTKPNFGGTKHTHRNPSPACNPWGGRTVSNQSVHRITLYRKPSCYGDHFDIKPGHYAQSTPWEVMSIGVWGP